MVLCIPSTITSFIVLHIVQIRASDQRLSTSKARLLSTSIFLAYFSAHSRSLVVYLVDYFLHCPHSHWSAAIAEVQLGIDSSRYGILAAAAVRNSVEEARTRRCTSAAEDSLAKDKAAAVDTAGCIAAVENIGEDIANLAIDKQSHFPKADISSLAETQRDEKMREQRNCWRMEG